LLSAKRICEVIAPIRIQSENTNAEDLYSRLTAQLPQSTEFDIQLQTNEELFRGADPNVVVAVVGLAGTAFGALISGLFGLFANKAGAYLELHGQDWSVKVPSGTSKERLDELISLAKERQTESIIIHE
jgi:hypothetical protein